MFDTPILFSVVSGYTFPSVRSDRNKNNRKRMKEIDLFNVKQTNTYPIQKRRKIELIEALPVPHTEIGGKTKKVSAKLQNATEISSKSVRLSLFLCNSYH